jgi:hypothetical protein
MIRLYTPLRFAALGAVCTKLDGVIANLELYPAETELDAQKTASLFLPDYVCEARF